MEAEKQEGCFPEENKPGGELVLVAAKGLLIRGAHAWISPRINDTPLLSTEYWLES